MILEAVIVLLIGCGVFISGMNMLGNGLERSAGGGMKRMLGRLTTNRFAGVGVGAGATAIIQSSSATSVMVIGFVNAGVMTLAQATSVIMGANIGTTVTGILVSLKSLNITLYASLLAFVGVMMMFLKGDRWKQIGGIFCGLGLIFVGLDIMGDAFDGTGLDVFFQTKVFANINFPLLLILCGVAFTALIQSSSAATGLFITMVGAGALNLDSALFLVLGSNIGTCVTALLACLGASTNAKRTALIHLTFNVIGTVVFSVFIWIFTTPVVNLLQSVVTKPEMQLAWFHVVFNVTTTLLLLPFIKQLVWLAEKVIPEKKKVEKEERHLRFVDERLLKTPHVALGQVKKEVEYMAALAKENLERSFAALSNEAEKYETAITENERAINFTNKALTKYLISLAPLVDRENERAIGSYFHVLNDLERVGDHAENFGEIALQMQSAGLVFSENALAELKEMQEKVLRMFAIAETAFDKLDAGRLNELTALENEVDGLKKNLSSRHYARLAAGECKVELSPYFSSYISGLERVADHLVNVGYSILNPTGSQSEARAALV
ncbi:MAG: Na/Pi cotransporter family protein [Clostridia bacterium]|nr:Na/Pi cotransporter family protein [Clostridia bacterium]